MCRGLRTSLGCCMRCAQSAAGESPPNPKVQHVHYDTGPRATGNRRASGCCGAPARQRPVRRISRNIAHPGRTENSTPGPMSVLPRQLHQRSHRSIVENIRCGGECTPSGTPSSSRVQIGGRRAAGRLGVSAAHRAVGNNIPRGSDEPNFGYHVRAVRRSASTPPVLVSRTTSLSPRGTLFPAACAESITGLLSANTHALASALYYPHTSQLRSTRYILPHAVRHLPCPSSSRARALLKYRPYNFLLEDPAKPNLFSS